MSQISWREAALVYFDRRILTILALGFSSGLPLALTTATMAVWLTEAGVSLQAIGLFALVGLPYTFKFLWAPLMDHVRFPLLTRLLGRRRSWMVVTQISLMVALFALGGSDPAQDPWAMAALALIVAFCSASQDIIIDAYRVEILDPSQFGAGAAVVQFGYRLAMLVSGAGALFLAQYSESWAVTYWVMAALILVGLITVLLNKEPTPGTALPQPKSPAAWIKLALVEPFWDMARRNGKIIIAILAFVLLYKLGDAFAGAMANPFYIQLGFTKAEIASVSKLFGFGATILGTFIGGLMVPRFGILRALLLCGILQMGSNLMFAWQATMGHDVAALTLTIAVENLSGGMGSAAFVAYISGLCNLNFTATQYALLSALATAGRTFLAASAGAIAQRIGWFDFFLISTLVALPGILLLMWLKAKLLGSPQETNVQTTNPV